MAALWSSVHSKMKIFVYAETGFFFSTLSGLVEFDGYYLESDPCLVCNNPEVPFCVSDFFNVNGPEAHGARGFLLPERGCSRIGVLLMLGRQGYESLPASLVTLNRNFIHG